MIWGSDTFTQEDARDVLAFFSAEDVNQQNCAALHKYLGEIPPPHTAAEYAAYHDQLPLAATRVVETDSKAAELWLWALTVRALSFEVEQGFEGPVRWLLNETVG